MGCSTSGFSPARPLRCRSASCPGSRASPICLPVRRGRTSSSWSSASSWRRVGALSRRHCASWGAIVIPPSAQSAARVGSPTDLPGNLNRTRSHAASNRVSGTGPLEIGIPPPETAARIRSEQAALGCHECERCSQQTGIGCRLVICVRDQRPHFAPDRIDVAQYRHQAQRVYVQRKGALWMSLPDGRFIPLGQSSTPSMIFALWRARRRLLHGATPSVIRFSTLWSRNTSRW